MADIDTMVALQRAAPIAVGFEREGLILQVEQQIGIAKLRIYGNEPNGRFQRIVGHTPPRMREQAKRMNLSFAWLAPGEWLATGPEAEIAALVVRAEAKGGDEALTTDFTHARTAFLLSGSNARGALAAHCPLDLWPDIFPVNAVARSLLGDTGMFIARLADESDGPHFRIIVDQTMAAYAARMLAGA